MGKEKGFIKAILLIIIILAVIGGIWYYKSKKQEIPAPPGASQQEQAVEQATTTATSAAPAGQQQAPKTQISNWKTYRSAKYKVELQHPSSWILKESYLNISGDLLVATLKGWYTDPAGKFKANTIDEMVSQEIIARNFENFGRNPSASKTTAAGQEARLIVSQKGEGAARAGLIVKYPKPVVVDNIDSYYFMIKFSRSDYLTEIKNTIKFLP
ncbi:MAG: hypothetical protein HY773_02880 [Candidatus Terrybacteria bacterium]|nr:hypothetical protein [Candidatus Terrybacteria bacterium]